MTSMSILSRIIDTACHRPLDARDIQRFRSHVYALPENQKRILINTLMNAAASCPIKGAFQALLQSGLRINSQDGTPVMCTTLMDAHQAQADDIATLLCHHDHDGSDTNVFAVTLDQIPGLKTAVFSKNHSDTTNILINNSITALINSEAS